MPRATDKYGLVDAVLQAYPYFLTYQGINRQVSKPPLSTPGGLSGTMARYIEQAKKSIAVFRRDNKPDNHIEGLAWRSTHHYNLLTGEVSLDSVLKPEDLPDIDYLNQMMRCPYEPSWFARNVFIPGFENNGKVCYFYPGNLQFGTFLILAYAAKYKNDPRVSANMIYRIFFPTNRKEAASLGLEYINNILDHIIATDDVSESDIGMIATLINRLRETLGNTATIPDARVGKITDWRRATEADPEHGYQINFEDSN